MGFNLGDYLTPPPEREYVWWGDDAIDRERSDFVRWFGDGRSGLVFLDGRTPTIFRWVPLAPTQVKCLVRESRAGVALPSTAPVDMGETLRARTPALTRLMLAYALQSIDGAGIEFSRIQTTRGLRLPDAGLDAMDRAPSAGYVVKLPAAPENPDAPTERRVGIEVLEHLGMLVVNASAASGVEKKA